MMSDQLKPALAIDSIPIRQDADGRYCLNDLHKAAGGENRHRPSLWLANKQTIELIKEIEKAGIPAIQSKQQLGSFVAWELVYAYAMWISAAFHLKVIRAYHAMMTNTSKPTPTQGLPTALRNLASVIQALSVATLALADECECRAATKASAPVNLKQLPDREMAFLQAWKDCLGTKTVTTSDLYRAVATQQCQELNNSSGALLGDVTQWTPKKLSYALKRWSEQPIDGYKVVKVGKSSHGTLWRLEPTN